MNEGQWMLVNKATDSQMWSTHSMPAAVPPAFFFENFSLNSQDNCGGGGSGEGG